MGYGCNIEQRRFKRQIWEVNSSINENKNKQKELIDKIDNITTKLPDDKSVRRFLEYQIIPLQNQKTKLVEDLKLLLSKQIDLQKTLIKEGAWINKRLTT